MTNTTMTHAEELMAFFDNEGPFSRGLMEEHCEWAGGEKLTDWKLSGWGKVTDCAYLFRDKSMMIFTMHNMFYRQQNANGEFETYDYRGRKVASFPSIEKRAP